MLKTGDVKRLEEYDWNSLSQIIRNKGFKK